MADYIDREELLKELHIRHWDVMIDFIEDEIPSVDVIEVVRCKDCKHFKETSEIKGECTYWKVLPTIYPFKEDYCARGETE